MFLSPESTEQNYGVRQCAWCMPNGIAVFASPHLELIDGAGEILDVCLCLNLVFSPICIVAGCDSCMAWPPACLCILRTMPSRGRQREPWCECGRFRNTSCSIRILLLPGYSSTVVSHARAMPRFSHPFVRTHVFYVSSKDVLIYATDTAQLGGCTVSFNIHGWSKFAQPPEPWGDVEKKEREKTTLILYKQSLLLSPQRIG